MTNSAEVLTLALRAYLDRQSPENMRTLDSALSHVNSTEAVAALWATLGVAVDSRVEAREQKNAADRLEKLVREALMDKKGDQISIQGTNVTVGQAGSNKVENSTVGGNVGASQQMTDCFNKVQSSTLDPAAKKSLEELHSLVTDLVAKESSDEKRKVIERDYTTLVAEATSKQPRRKWYEISGEGLVEAANALLGVGERAAKLVAGVKAGIATWY